MLKRLWVRWLEPWRSRPFAVRSSMTPYAAAKRLDADRSTAWTGLGIGSRGAGLRVVVGRVSQDRVRLVSRRRSRKNSWRPVLFARFVPTPGGCELVGSFFWHPAVAVFTALWFAGVALFVLTAVTPTVGYIAAGRWSAAFEGLRFAGAGLGMFALGVTMITFAGRAGIRDEQFLRAWIERRLRDDQ